MYNFIYKQCDKCIGVCKICLVQVIGKGGSITSVTLAYHLALSHPILYNKK